MKKRALMMFVSFLVLWNVFFQCVHSTCANAAVPTSYELDLKVLGTVTQLDATYPYSIKDLVSYYETNSMKYKEEQYKRKIDVVSGKLAIKDYTDLSTSLHEIDYNIGQLQTMKDTQIEYKDALLEQSGGELTDELKQQLVAIEEKIRSLDQQIAVYHENYNKVDANSNSLKLQKDIYVFYEENEASIDRESEYLLKYNFMKELYQLILMKEKIAYYNDMKESYELLYKAEQIKKKYGRSNELSLGLAETKVLDSDYNVQKYEHDYSQTYKSIMEELRLESNGKLKVEVEFGKKEYNVEILKQYFLTTNMTLINLRNLEKSYIEFARGFDTGSINWEKGYYTSLNYGYQADIYQKSIKQYVENMVSNYNYYFKQYELAKKQVIQGEKKLEALNKKLSYKRATKVEISQATYALDEARIKYYQYAFNIKLMEYVFDNYIYGVDLI